MKTFPLNQTQLAIFYAEQSAEGNYAINFLHHYGENVNLEKLCRAIEKMVAAHPHLMDRITLDDEGIPVFVVPEDKHYVQTIEQISTIDEVRASLIHKRDLLHEPLFTFRVMQGQDGGHLLFDVHHVISDGLTIGTLLKDIETAYAGGELTEEPVTAEQMNLAEAEKRNSTVYQEEKEWYNNTFGAIESESMPLKDVYDNRKCEYVLAWKQLSTTKEQIKALSAAAGVGTSVPFTAAYAMMLRAFTGDEQVAYSTYFHGRLNKSEMHTQTMMVRTLPICHDFTQLTTIQDLLSQTSDLMQNLRQKNSVSFGEVTKMCGISGAVSFIYQGAITGYGITLDGHSFDMDDLREHRPGLKINAQLIEKNGALWLRQEYPTDEYSQEIIAQMGDTYDHILSQMLNCDTQLSEITVCSEAQIAQLDRFNVNEMEDTFKEWENETIVSLFRKTVNKYSDNIAAVYQDKKYTYRQLDEVTDSLAALIRSKLAADPDTKEPVVSVLITRNEWMFIAPLAAMKAGCAYQPLDPSYPQERLNFMVKDANAALVIADRELRDIINEYDGPVFFTDETIPQAEAPQDSLTPSSLLILLYTSGSTGVPKGVMLEHRNVLAYCHFYQKQCQFTPETHTAAYASFGFDANMMDQYPTLLSGGTLYIIPEEIRLDMIALGEFFENNHISIAFMTTQVAQQFASTYDKIGDLRILGLGGEKMMSMELPSGYTMMNIYGPTECSVAVTQKMVEHNEPNIPIGKPTETTSLYIVDKNFHRIPAGAAGELLITGPQVGRSYLNRPDKTAEAFINFMGKHCYRTGDIVRYRENGDIEFVGRKDGQVKIRGFRIELKEVEAVIRDYQGISDATVQAYEYPDGGKYICAYIVSEQTIDIEKLNQFIMNQKPPYMVPAYTMQIERIPLNVNQKVDKKALPRPDASSSSNDNREKVAPSTPLQKKLYKIVADVLHNEDFGVTDALSFYGLSSILSIKLAVIIYKHFGIQLDSKEFVENGTILTIEDIIKKGTISAVKKRTVNVEEAFNNNGAPLSNAQLGVYIDCLMNEGSTMYNIPQYIVFPASVTSEALKAAMEKVIAAHHVLYVHFEGEGEEVRQVTDKNMPLPITIAEGDIETIKQSFVQPFDLNHGPLWRATIAGNKLLFDIHHLIADGGSISLFVRHICDVLNGENIEPESYTFFDHVRDELTTDTKAEEQFFDEQLEHASSASFLPEDKQDDEEDGCLQYVLQPLPHEKVENYCREQGITPAAFYLAATNILTSIYTAQDTTQICTISSGRSDLRICDTIGMFINTLPLVSHISDIAVRDYIHQTADTFKATLLHEHYPFALIAEKHGTACHLMYAYQVGVIEENTVHGEKVEIKTFGLEKPKFKLQAMIFDRGLELGYNDAIYSASYMEQVGQNFLTLVESMIANDNVCVSALNILSEEDKIKLQNLRAASTPTDENPVERLQSNIPMNALELQLHKLIADIIKNEEFGVADELSYFGLTSINAIKLATQIYKVYHVKLDAKSFVKGGSLQQIENAIIEHLLAPKDNADDNAPAGGQQTGQAQSKTTAPLGNAQIGIYYDCLKDETATTYNVPHLITFPGSVSATEIKKAVEQVIAAHPLLSAHFEMQNGQPVIVMNEDTTPQVVVTDGDIEAMKNDYARPFHLARGPLYRATIVNNTLLFDVHHLVMDGGSVSIFLHEVCEALEGRTPQSETYTYFDYATDEQHADQSAEEAFFDAQLITVDESTSLPIDLKGQEQEGHTATMDKPVNHAHVEEFCRKQGITPAAFYLAATYYIAARYCNTHDVQICTISNGRSNVQIADTIGMFVNTLPLVSHIEDITVGEFLKKTADDFTATLNHENYPFAKVAQKYGTRAELMYEYQLGVIEEQTVNGEAITIAPMHLEKPKFKTAIKILDVNGEVCVHINYNDELYSAEYMERLADSYAAVVENLMADTKAPLRKLSIMSQAQAEEVNRLHTTAIDEIPVKLLHQGVEKYAAETPDAKALISIDGEYTYAEVNAEMNRMAHALIARGIGKGDSVIILLPRSCHTLITLFGILKSGAAFIPCDPAYPEDRIALIREDSGAKLVVTEPVYQELMAESQNTTNPDVDIDPNDLAYMIYTSGSTGRPKGVMLRHIGICSYLTVHPANRHIYAVKQLVSTYLCVSTISFDMSLKEYGVCLFNGLTCVFAGDDETNNPLALAELMNRTHADCINATPSRVLQYMELPEFCECLKHCHVIMSGGEKYSDVLLNRLHELTKARIFNTYGPTEITVSSNGAELTKTNTISVGAPLLNYTEYVVDTDGNELPVGVVGELYIGGPGVAVGYNHLDELNATKYIDYTPCNPLLSGEPIRVFRSGDYARWQPDGQVIILGRADNQVKLRGLRIELGEVEAAIARVEGIKQVLVLIKTIQGKEHLCAYFVADRKMDIEELKEEIGKTLTHYMVPTAYMQMESFPLTPNGKTDFKHLPEPVVAQTAGEYVAPQTQAEKDFCEIFENILDIEKISVTDSFFEQGGSSLTATRVLIDAKAKGYELAYADVFKFTTPRALAAKVAPDAAQTESIPGDPEITDYDYSKIDALLKGNNLEAFQKGERLQLGDVVLTGATGYLGIHILHELLENNNNNNIYVLVRATRDMTAELRLKGLLFYYFENTYDEMFSNGRIVIVEGDVTNPEAFDRLTAALPQMPSAEHPLTVINCAAVVKHFSEGTEIEDVNIGGVRTCIDFCLKTGAHLIQTSTNSTGGTVVGDKGNYSEQVHYVGQILSGSKYIHSKFIAERMVLESVIEKGLVAKVVRLGNLSARATDGEFQINYRTNSAMGRLHIFQMLGCCGFSQMASQMEFSPIDEVAQSILLLSTAPKECVIFHAFNNHTVLLGDVVDEMAKTLGVDIRYVEESEFENAVAEAGKDPEKAKVLQSILAYRGMSQGHAFPKYNPYTIQVLARLGFRWNVTSWDYVQRFIGVIASLEFFTDHR